MTSRDATFRDRYGLHPRSAHRIVETLAPLDARVTLERVDDPGRSLDARSMLALISAGIRTGDVIRIEADGPDADAATAALGDLFEAGVCHP